VRLFAVAFLNLELASSPILGPAEDELGRLRDGDIGAGDQPSPDTAAQRAFIRSWKPGM